VAAEPEQLEREIAQSRAQLGRDVDALAEKVSPRAAARRGVRRVKSAARSIRENMMGTASDVARSAGDNVTDWRHHVNDTVSGAKESVADAADTATRTARRRVTGSPLAAGAVAFGIGWLASSLIPTSRTETELGSAVRRTVSEHGDAVREQFGAAASEVVDNLRQPARNAADDVQQTVADAATNVKDEARHQTANLTNDSMHAGQR
jgi:gas vesicle protein